MDLQLQLHMTGHFREWGEMRGAVIALLREINDAAQILGPDEIARLADPVVIDLELENRYKVDGLVGYDILFDDADGVFS